MYRVQLFSNTNPVHLEMFRSSVMRKKLGFFVFNGLWAVYFSLWIYLHLRLCHSVSGQRLAIEILLIFQNIFLLIFFVIRRLPKVTSWKPWDVTLAFLGSFATTLFWSSQPRPPRMIGTVLQALGTLMTFYGTLSLGRSYGMLPANRRIETGGMYRFIRHPIYASYQIFALGYLINQPSFYNVAVGVISFLSQVLRIFAEEKLLAQDPEYRKYRERVRWRMFPYLY